MAKKPKAKKQKKYAGKTEKEWEEWGEEFGKSMERLGCKLCCNMEKQSKEEKCRCMSNPAWPLLWAVWGIFVLAVVSWLLTVVNFLHIGIIDDFYSFVM